MISAPPPPERRDDRAGDFAAVCRDTYPIECPADFEPAAQVFEHLRVIATPDAYASFQKRIGEWGLAVCRLDGENDQLFPLYCRAEFDMAESVCVRPMVKNTLKKIQEGPGRGKTVWGGIPSVALIRDNMGDRAFEDFGPISRRGGV